MFAGPTRWLCALAVGAFAAAGCGSAPAAAVHTHPAAVASVHAVWDVHEGAGFTVELHTGWVAVDPKTLAGAAAIHKMEAENPGLTRSFKAFAELATQPGVLIAFDRTAAGRRIAKTTGFAPNILIRPFPLDPLTSDARLLKEVLAQGRVNAATLGNLVGAPVTTRLRIAGLPARGVTYTFHENTVAGRQLVTESDNVTVRNGTAFLIFCTTVHSDLSRFRPFCAHALSSFAFSD